MKMIHIIYDNINNPWLGGGGANRTHEIYKRLIKRHDILVVTGNFPQAEKEIDGVRYKTIGLKNNYIISRLSFFIFIYFYLPFLKADIFIEDVGFPSPLIVTAFRKNTIASIQFIPNNSYVQKRGGLGLLVRILFSFGLKFYNSFITVSQYAADNIRSISSAPIFIIPNGITIPKDIKSNGSERYLLYLGRIDTIEKGLDTLLTAIKYLKDSNLSIKVKLVGTGQKREIKIIQKLITQLDLKDNISLQGPAHGIVKHTLLRDCYFLVQPSRNESFGITALEAFSYKKPVIGSNVGGLGELLKNSGAGLLCETADWKKLADNIRTLYKNKLKVTTLGKKGFNFSLQFSWDEIAKKQEQVINKFIK